MKPDTDSWDLLPGARVPFGWHAFFQKHGILYRDHGGLRAVAGPAALQLSLLCVGQAGWALDQRLYPGWKKSSMRGPLFILGHQRSGTTFLHRLLSRDSTHARAMRLHEMLLPASSVQNGLAGLAAWDRRSGGRLASRFQGLQDRLFGPLEQIHRVRFDEVEEDEFVLWAIYASAMCVNDSPINTANEELDELRHFHRWSPERQRRTLGWYRACLLKKVHREPAPPGCGPVWGVSKNPAFTQKIPEIRKVFPDARLIYLVRDPREAIPSRLSLIRAIWRHRFKEFNGMTPSQVKAILQDSLRTYLLAEKDLPGVPPHQKVVIRYEDLVKGPRRTVEAIYSRFGLPGPDAALETALDGLRAGSRVYDSKHEYSLEEFGLTPGELQDRLAPVFERYSFTGN